MALTDKKSSIKNYALFFIVLLISLVNSAYSQLNYLAVGASNGSGSYTDLGSNGTAIITANFDDDNSAPQNIGFNFSYNGIVFTQFVLNTNGFIKLGNTNPSVPNLFFSSSSSNTNGIFNSALPADVNILSVFNHDLQAGTGTPEYRLYTSGTTGSRICTIQFKNVREKTTSPQYDNMEFQIKLYETTNTIEFVYGTWVPSANSSSTRSAAVGLKGSDNTSAQLIVANKVSLSGWNTISITDGNYTGINAFKYGNPSSRPAPDAGRTLRFTQAFPNDAMVVHLFTLGSIPIPYGAPQVDSVIIRNMGLNTLTNLAVTLNITGANTFTNTQVIPSLASGAIATIGFAPYTPTNLGTNTVSVTVANDDNNLNNTSSCSQIVNYTVFSYADTTKAAGGISGQNYPGYLLTRYTIMGTTSVASANIYIAKDSASIGQKVYAIIFDAAGNKLDSSATLTITVADTGKYHNFTLPAKPVISNASFYIGLAQPAIGYNALGYQREPAPVRLGAYYIRSMNDIAFADLGGLNSYSTYRYMIQAIITNTTGVLMKQVLESNITPYPNPFNHSTTFKIPGNSKDLSFNLYDVTGRVVKKVTGITTAEFNFEREDLQNGVYFYSIFSSNEVITLGKLVVE